MSDRFLDPDSSDVTEVYSQKDERSNGVREILCARPVTFRSGDWEGSCLLVPSHSCVCVSELPLARRDIKEVVAYKDPYLAFPFENDKSTDSPVHKRRRARFLIVKKNIENFKLTPTIT